MDLNSRLSIAGRLVLLALCSTVTPCAAQSAWKPEKPVEFVVLSAPGGGNDRTARLLQKIWREAKWLENINVLNKPGGGGALAYTYVSQHPGDGHYIAVVRKGVLTNHILGRSALHYTELTPLAVMANEPNAIAVRADFPVKTARDLGEQLKSDPQSITTSVGSTRGGPSHMMVVQLAKLAGGDARKLKIVTFSGSAESVTNLLGGHIQAISSSVDALVPHQKSGAMRILGVATAKRAASLPGVPTFREQGYDLVFGNWTAIMGPKGLAPAQIAYWEDLLERTFRHPAWQGMIEADALEADFRKSQPMRELLARDDELERRMLTELGMVKPDAASK
jgi:putative tricarboxylic transport membrane protein